MVSRPGFYRPTLSGEHVYTFIPARLLTRSIEIGRLLTHSFDRGRALVHYDTSTLWYFIVFSF